MVYQKKSLNGDDAPLKRLMKPDSPAKPLIGPAIALGSREISFRSAGQGRNRRAAP